MEEQARLPPVAPYRALRPVAKRGDLAEGVAAEEVEVHEFGEPRLEGGQLVERVGEAVELDGGTSGLLGGGRDVGSEGDLERTAAALLRPRPARIVNEEPAHRPRCVTHEPRAIGEVYPF